MKIAVIKDATQGGKVVALIPLFVWKLTGWLCARSGPAGLLGGHILMSYEWNYAGETGRSWWAPLVSGVRMWWGCRGEWTT